MISTEENERLEAIRCTVVLRTGFISGGRSNASSTDYPPLHRARSGPRRDEPSEPGRWDNVCG